MKLKDIVSQLANRINQPHVIEVFLRQVYAKGFVDGTKQSPWISIKDQLPIPEIEYIEGIEYGSIDVLGEIQSSHGTCYCVCRYWGYDKEYRWENGIVPERWMPIPKFNE